MTTNRRATVAVNPSKTSRHECIARASANGTVAIIPPTPVEPTSINVAIGRRPGNQRVDALIPAMRLADMPIPSRNRPRIRSTGSSARTNNRAPAMAVASKNSVVRRGPNRSSANPKGNCEKPKAIKKTLRDQPQLRCIQGNSALKSGAIKPFAIRNMKSITG